MRASTRHTDIAYRSSADALSFILGVPGQAGVFSVRQAMLDYLALLGGANSEVAG